MTLQRTPSNSLPARYRAGNNAAAPTAPPLADKPKRWEELFVAGTLFTLTVDTPNAWFRQFYGFEGTRSALLFFTPVLLFATVLGLLRFPAFSKAAKTEPLFMMLVAWAMISSVWSTTGGQTARQTVAWALTSAFGFWVAIRFPLKRVLTLYAQGLLVATALNLAWVLVFTQWGHINVWWNPLASGWKGITSNKNSLGQLSAMSIVILTLAWRVVDRRKALYLLGAAANLFILLNVDSKTALVACIGTLILALMFRLLRAQRQLFAASVLLLLVTGALSLVLVLQNFQSFAAGLGRNGDLTGRTQLWGDLWPEFLDRPIIGYGWSGFWNGWFSPAHQVWLKNTWQPPDAHNQFFQIAIDLGIIGVLLFYGGFLRTMSRAVIYVRDRAEPVALVPLVFLTYLLLSSITEHGTIGRSSQWAFLLVCVVTVGQHKQSLKRAAAATRARPAHAAIPRTGEPKPPPRPRM